MPPLPPRQHSANICCTKNDQPIVVTVHSHCVRALQVSYRDVGEGGRVAVNCEKTQFFLNTLYIIFIFHYCCFLLIGYKVSQLMNLLLSSCDRNNLIYRVVIKNCVFFTNSLQPLPNLQECITFHITYYNYSFFLDQNLIYSFGLSRPIICRINFE